ncbi:MAG: head decoration protein [Proteobacteria bacterium]|nr:head decoration protein [Pseudomonadota bacterium]
MTVKTEPATLGDAIKWEEDDNYSRKTITVKSGESVALAEVMGKIAKTTPSTGTAGTNTGNGTCGSVAAGAQTKLGTYTLTCKAAAANAGTFAVKDPEGNSMPEATVAVAYANPQLNFTLADGSTDFVIGDSFTIAVTAGSGKYVALDPTAVDGSQVAAGIMVAAVDASGADTQGVIINGDALVATGNLVWPSGISEDDKAKAIAELDALGIKAVSLA